MKKIIKLILVSFLLCGCRTSMKNNTFEKIIGQWYISDIEISNNLFCSRNYLNDEKLILWKINLYKAKKINKGFKMKLFITNLYYYNGELAINSSHLNLRNVTVNDSLEKVKVKMGSYDWLDGDLTCINNILKDKTWKISYSKDSICFLGDSCRLTLIEKDVFLKKWEEKHQLKIKR